MRRLIGLISFLMMFLSSAVNATAATDPRFPVAVSVADIQIKIKDSETFHLFLRHTFLHLRAIGAQQSVPELTSYGKETHFAQAKWATQGQIIAGIQYLVVLTKKVDACMDADAVRLTVRTFEGSNLVALQDILTGTVTIYQQVEDTPIVTLPNKQETTNVSTNPDPNMATPQATVVVPAEISSPPAITPREPESIWGPTDMPDYVPPPGHTLLR